MLASDLQWVTCLSPMPVLLSCCSLRMAWSHCCTDSPFCFCILLAKSVSASSNESASITDELGLVTGALPQIRTAFTVCHVWCLNHIEMRELRSKQSMARLPCLKGWLGSSWSWRGGNWIDMAPQIHWHSYENVFSASSSSCRLQGRLAMVWFSPGLGTFWLNLNLKYQVQSSRQLNPKPEPLKLGLKGSNLVWTSLNLQLNKPNFYFFYLFFFLIFFSVFSWCHTVWLNQIGLTSHTVWPMHTSLLLPSPVPYHFKNNVSHSFYNKLIDFLI